MFWYGKKASCWSADAFKTVKTAFDTWWMSN